jgi:hypothetical protein
LNNGDHMEDWELLEEWEELMAQYYGEEYEND